MDGSMNDKPKIEAAKMLDGYGWFVVKKHAHGSIILSKGLDERTAREFACARDMATVIKAMVMNGVVGVATADIIDRLECKGKP